MRLALLALLLLPSCVRADWIARREVESVSREHEEEFVRAIAGQRRMTLR